MEVYRAVKIDTEAFPIPLTCVPLLTDKLG